VLFGAGYNGRLLLDKLMRYGITPDYFVDNNPEIGHIEYLDTSGGKYVSSP
jgi:hypothetical protein